MKNIFLFSAIIFLPIYATLSTSDLLQIYEYKNYKNAKEIVGKEYQGIFYDKKTYRKDVEPKIINDLIQEGKREEAQKLMNKREARRLRKEIIRFEKRCARDPVFALIVLNTKDFKRIKEG